MERKLGSLKQGLKEARRKAGLTQTELAEQLCVHVKTVMNWEQGKVTPSLESLIQLSEELDCDLDYLTGRLSEPTHDIQFFHDKLGLTGEAVKKLQGNPGLMFVLSLLIEQKDFDSWLFRIQNYLNDLLTDRDFPPKTKTDIEDELDEHDEKQYLIFKSLIKILEDIPLNEYETRLVQAVGKWKIVEN